MGLISLMKLILGAALGSGAYPEVIMNEFPEGGMDEWADGMNKVFIFYHYEWAHVFFIL